MPQAPATISTPPDSEAVPTEMRKRRGFAAMDPAAQREIASQGGRAAHASGKAHQFTKEEARAAGAKKRRLTNPSLGTGSLEPR